MVVKVKLELDEGRVYGARYWTVTPKFPAHTVTWFKPEWDAMLEWCNSTFGSTSEDGVWTPNQRWYVNDLRFWFRNDADRTMFILRWS